MYWFRDQSFLVFIPWLIDALAWFLGGWLITSHAFKIEGNKRLIVGFGLGLIVNLWLINLVGHWIAPPLAYHLSALIVLLVGLIFSIKSGEPLFYPAVVKVWPILILWAGVFIYSLMLERGLKIFDDQLQLPAISVIANGGFPPKYFLNASSQFAYHYGFQILAASLMRIGGMFPWSASDFAKALIWSYSLILLGLIIHRYIKNIWKTIVAVVIFTFLGNTRYLLMLLPANVLQTFDGSIGFLGVSTSMNAPFSKALFMPWDVVPGPPTPYIFGFQSGIYASYHMYHSGQLPLALVLVFLIWLLYKETKTWKSIPFLAILLSYLALTYESAYALIAASFVLLFILQKIKRKAGRLDFLNPLLMALFISIPFAFLQGGSLLSLIQSAFFKFLGNQPQVSVHNLTEQVISINWPPSIFSTNFGDLSLFDPRQLMVGLLDIGPILFFVPILTKWAWIKFMAGEWMVGSLATCSLMGFLTATFLRYNPSRDAITRFSELVIVFWYVFFVILIFEPKNGLKKIVQIFAILCLVLVSVSGAANFLTQLSAIPKPVLSDHITSLDARISSQTWGRLPNDEIIFDPNPFDGRASVVTGLPTVVWEYRQVLPFWQELYDNPSLKGILQNKYRYVYIDERWWAGLTESQKASLSNPCIRVVAEAATDNEFRRLLNLEQCKISS